MAIKFLVILTVAKLCSVMAVQYQEYDPATGHHNIPLYKKTIDEAPAEYEFTYGVHDEHTKDIKMQKESRKGDSVKGSYELIDSDGFKRIVEYTADDDNGFQAIVHREKTNIVIPIPEPKLQKLDIPYHSYQQPIVHQQYIPNVQSSYVAPAKISAPAKYLAPIIQKSYVSQGAVKYIEPKHNYESDVGTHVTFHGSAGSYKY